MGKIVKPVVRPKAKATRKLAEPKKSVGVQTTSVDDAGLVTAEEPLLEFWKMLAKTREKTIEKLMEENESLRDKVELLESENRVLEELAEDAKKLAEFVSSLPEDPDESGIVRD